MVVSHYLAIASQVYGLSVFIFLPLIWNSAWNIMSIVNHLLNLSDNTGLPELFSVPITIWLGSSSPNCLDNHLLALLCFLCFQCPGVWFSAQIFNSLNVLVCLPICLSTLCQTSFTKYLLSTYFLDFDLLIMVKRYEYICLVLSE